MSTAETTIEDVEVAKKRDPAKRGTSVKLPVYLVDQLRELAVMEKEDMQAIIERELAPRVAELLHEAYRRKVAGLPLPRRRKRQDRPGESAAGLESEGPESGQGGGAEPEEKGRETEGGSI